ncbi:hypothetical protein [Streptomyces goshikiensis]
MAITDSDIAGVLAAYLERFPQDAGQLTESLRLLTEGQGLACRRTFPMHMTAGALLVRDGGCAGRGRAGYDAHAVGGVGVLVGHLALVAAPDAVAAHHHPDAAVLDGRRDRAPTINHDRFLL